jgi:hypothetical protein
MSKFSDEFGPYLSQQLRNPEVRAGYDAEGTPVTSWIDRHIGGLLPLVRVARNIYVVEASYEVKVTWLRRSLDVAYGTRLPRSVRRLREREIRRVKAVVAAQQTTPED